MAAEQSDDHRRVGFIGLGDIGKPMARRLVAWPGGLTVFDVAPGPARELGDLGATVADTVAELAAACDVISIMVRTDDQVRDVMGQIVGSARPGTTVAVHSTVSPDLPAELEKVCSEHDLMFLDAPVSGGAMGAEAGTLVFLVGGSTAAHEAAKGPFALMSASTMHCGPAGNGTIAKLARNLLTFVSYTATGETARLAEAAGIDLVALGQVVRQTDAITGGPGSIMHRDTTAPLAQDDPWAPILEHPLALGTKDLAHAIELADRLGVEVPMAKYALENLGWALGLRPPGHAAVEASPSQAGAQPHG
jgi:3-hydroxyisobutyrate dehydrogenase